MKMSKSKRKMIICLCILGIILLCTPLLGYITPNDPYKTNLADALLAPCSQYPFGTDNLGRCILSRVMAGAASSVFSALTVVAIVFVVGVTIGIVSGYLGGALDTVIMRITLVFQAFPSFILAIAVAGILGPGIRNGIISLSLVYWTTYARLGRSLVITLKDSTYIRAAKMCGAGKVSIMTKYIIPNMVSPVVVTAALDVGNIILVMAGLSFLGLGAARPSAEWGAVMSEARNYLQSGPWGLIFPGIALFIIVVLFNITGDSIRDVIDTKSDLGG